MNKKTIKRVVKSINPDISVHFHKGVNESDIVNQIVYYNFTDGWLDDDMQDTLNVTHRFYPSSTLVSPEVFVILHEVGHIESLAHYQPTSVGVALQRYTRSIRNIVEKDRPYRLQARRYVQIQLERKANVWVTDFIRSNPDKVQELEQAFAK
jgi:hypothetical protein